MKVALAQLAPVLLDRDRTLAKLVDAVAEAGRAGAELVAFGETILPAYPVWLSRTNGAAFENEQQKSLHSRYLDQAVCLEAGHLDPLCQAARSAGVTVVVGVAERPQARGGYTIYCSAVTISAEGEILSAHRKLVPTYEERLAWGAGDGAGLVVQPLGPFHLGSLNCWENWLPLARAALHAQGEDLHVALWPGSRALTESLTPVLAREGRSYALSVSALIRGQDVPADVPLRDQIVAAEDELLYDGGSCLAGPDGRWLIEPVVGREELLYAELDPALVRRERQNLDISGHYSRPDVLRLSVNRTRQQVLADE